MRRTSHTTLIPALVLSLLAAPACSDDDTGLDGSTSSEEGDGGGALEVPTRYAFASRFDDADSVSYPGQTFRQVLISSLKTEMGAIQDEIENDAAVFASGEVRARLELYYLFDSDSAGSLPHGVTTSPAAAQASFDDISSGKNLREKIAGQDAIGQHKDWNAEGIVGWGSGLSPDALVDQWLDDVDALAVSYSSGSIPTDPDGAAIPKWYVDAQGRDYQQLFQKFLLGAVNYSQGVDDYLDDSEAGKGLLADNELAEEGANYTALEHAWDEGFGYWGAARDYLAYDDATLADVAAQDHDGDGEIDLLSEYNFGASINASKRDNGAPEQAPTDLSAETMTAFLTGRAIISHAAGPLSESELQDLQAQRDLAVRGWENALAATAVHYINDTLQDLNDDASAFADLATHWSELKGFVLALQFNPRKQLSDAQLVELNNLIGGAPALDAQYQANLIAARAILAEAYGFDATNLGDALGEGGW